MVQVNRRVSPPKVCNKTSWVDRISEPSNRSQWWFGVAKNYSETTTDRDLSSVLFFLPWSWFRGKWQNIWMVTILWRYIHFSLNHDDGRKGRFNMHTADGRGWRMLKCKNMTSDIKEESCRQSWRSDSALRSQQNLANILWAFAKVLIQSGAPKAPQDAANWIILGALWQVHRDSTHTDTNSRNPDKS